MLNISKKIKDNFDKILLLKLKDVLINQKTIILDDDNFDMEVLDDSFFCDDYFQSCDSRINQFLNEFSDPYDIMKYRNPKGVRNFIEKMAIWYELKYSNCYISKLMACGGTFDKWISDDNFIYLRDNDINEDDMSDDNILNSIYLQIQRNKSEDIDITRSFYESLSEEEKGYFDYHKFVYLDCSFNTHFCISSDGIIQRVASINRNSAMATLPEEFFEPFIGRPIDDIKEIANQIGIYVSDSSIKRAIKVYNDDVYFRNELLNCVMYKLIERGGSNIGAKRAFLFATEFNCDIDIPMKYGVDYTDYNLREFINMYLKAGGSTDLVCFVNNSDSNDSELKKDTVTIQELVEDLWHSDDSKYTPEEDSLHQRFVNVLNSYSKQKSGCEYVKRKKNENCK